MIYKGDKRDFDVSSESNVFWGKQKGCCDLQLQAMCLRSESTFGSGVTEKLQLVAAVLSLCFSCH